MHPFIERLVFQIKIAQLLYKNITKRDANHALNFDRQTTLWGQFWQELWLCLLNTMDRANCSFLTTADKWQAEGGILPQFTRRWLYLDSSHFLPYLCKNIPLSLSVFTCHAMPRFHHSTPTTHHQGHELSDPQLESLPKSLPAHWPIFIYSDCFAS